MRIKIFRINYFDLVITKETNLEQKNFLIDLEFIINIKNQ